MAPLFVRHFVAQSPHFAQSPDGPGPLLRFIFVQVRDTHSRTTMNPLPTLPCCSHKHTDIQTHVHTFGPLIRSSEDFIMHPQAPTSAKRHKASHNVTNARRQGCQALAARVRATAQLFAVVVDDSRPFFSLCTVFSFQAATLRPPC